MEDIRVAIYHKTEVPVINLTTSRISLMFRKVVVNAIRKTKNPKFELDPAVSTAMLLDIVFDKSVQLFRGQRFYSFPFGFKWVFIGKSVKLTNKRNISIGKSVVLDDYVSLSAISRELLKLGNGVRIGKFTQVSISADMSNIGGAITIQDNVAIGEFSHLGGAGGLEIGQDCIIGQYFSTHPENHNYNLSDEPIRLQGTTRIGIKVGKNCWIGSKVTLLDGADIGDNCVVAAGSVVRGSFEKSLVIGGVPAKVIKSYKTPSKD